MSGKNVIPCGFGVYVDPDEGSTFRKVAGELIESTSEIAEAEKRYVERHKKKEGSVKDE